MGFSDIFKKDFLASYTSSDVNVFYITAVLIITCLIAFYIFMVYRLVTRKTFYSRSFNISIASIAVITAAIILAVQSSIVISLGMVGALSIVRFRTAIKEPIRIPISKAPMILVANLKDGKAEPELIDKVKEFCKYYKVKSRNLSAERCNLILEVRLAREYEMVQAISALPDVETVSLVSHDGEVTF